MAHERVTLYGVPLVADRLVSYGKVDAPLAARALHPARARLRRVGQPAQVPGDQPPAARGGRGARAPGPAPRHRGRRAHPLRLLRRPDPGPTSSAARTSTSGGSSERQQRGRPADLRPVDAHPRHRRRDHARPTTRSSGTSEGLTFPISYHFEPGAADDGLTIDVPVATLNRVEADDFSWNVPGLREELVTSLIRSLPKNLRVNFVPAPNKAREFLAAAPPGEEPLLDALERWCRVDDRRRRAPRGLGLGQGRPSTCARRTASSTTTAGSRRAARTSRRSRSRCGRSSPQAIAEVASDSGLARTGETSWVFDTIEASFTQRRAGHEVQVYPALVDEGATVGLQVFGSAEEQEARHRLGVRRLLLLELDVAGQADPRRADQRREARPGRARRTPASPSCSRTAGPRWCRTSSTRGRRCATRRRTTRCCSRPPAATTRRTCARRWAT